MSEKKCQHAAAQADGNRVLCGCGASWMSVQSYMRDVESSSPATPEPRYPHRAEFSVNDEAESAVESPTTSEPNENFSETCKNCGRENIDHFYDNGELPCYVGSRHPQFESAVESPEQTYNPYARCKCGKAFMYHEGNPYRCYITPENVEQRSNTVESPEQRLERELGFRIEFRGTTPIIYDAGGGCRPISSNEGSLWRKCLTLMEQVEQLTKERDTALKDCGRYQAEGERIGRVAAEAKLREQANDMAKLFAAVGPMDEFDGIDDVVGRIKALREQAEANRSPHQRLACSAP